MAIVALSDLKDQLGLTDDLGTADDALLRRILAAAEDHVNRLVGFSIEEAGDAEERDGFADGFPRRSATQS